MEIVGFILFILGAAGMDSNGKWFYVAAGLVIVGLFMMHTGEVIKDWKKKANRRKYGNFNKFNH